MVSKIISRDDYLNQLIAFKDKQLIKVITGIEDAENLDVFIRTILRRSQSNKCKLNHVINLEDYDFYDMRDLKRLYIYQERLLLDRW